MQLFQGFYKHNEYHFYDLWKSALYHDYLFHIDILLIYFYIKFPISSMARDGKGKNILSTNWLSDNEFSTRVHISFSSLITLNNPFQFV